MVAMQVTGTMTLGDLITQARACGAEVVVLKLRVRSSIVFDVWHTPRFLVLNGERVPLPKIDDDAYMLDMHTLEGIRLRLGLEMEITPDGIRLSKPNSSPPLKVVK